MRKRILSLLLVMVFVLTGLWGCSNNTGTETGQMSNQDNTQGDTQGNEENESTSMGRYMEKKISLPEMGGNDRVLSILLNKNKQIEVYAIKDFKYKRYELKDDLSWEESEAEWLNIDLSPSAMVTDICLGYDGNYYCAFMDYANNTSAIYKSADGITSEEVKIPFLSENPTTIKDRVYYPSVDKLQVLADGSIVLHDMFQDNKIFAFSSEGEEIDAFRIGISQIYATTNFTATEKYIIAITEDCKGVMVYDPIEKQVVQLAEINDLKDFNSFALKNDGTLFLGNAGGIHRLQKDGTLWETTVDGSLNSMSMPTLEFKSLYVTEGDQEEYYGVYGITNGSGYQLMHYVYDKNVPSVPSKEITVYSLQENNTVRQAVSLFQAQNPDVRVNYVVAMADGSENTSDYIRALNTELLAGNGADILVLDGLPVDSYIEKGVLSDISEVLMPLESSGELLTNITDCYKEEGKIYKMPLRFTMPVIAGNKEAIQAADSLDSIVNYINKNQSKPYLDMTSYNLLLKDCLALYSKDLLHNSQLNEENMKAFLKNVKILAQNIKAEENYNKLPGGSNVKWLFDNSGLFQGRVITILSKTQAVMSQVKNIEDSMLLFAAERKSDNSFQSINQNFLPVGMIGLNSKSKEADIAKQFIRFLFERDVQDGNVYDGFPVNKGSIESWMNSESLLYIGITSEDEELDGGWPEKEERDSLYQMILKLNQPIEADNMLDNIIIEAAIPYLNGEMDENQTITTMKSKINTYMAE